MRGGVTLPGVVRGAVSIVALLLIAYIAIVAVTGKPWFGEFGASGSELTIAIVIAVLAIACVLNYRPHGAQRPGVPIAIVVVLAATTIVLGVASFWHCADATHPTFFTALSWTAALFTGETDDPSINSQCMPHELPVALDVARLSAFGLLSVSAALVATKLFQDRLDRLRVAFASSVTAVVDIDDDAQPMISTIKKSLVDDRGDSWLGAIKNGIPSRAALVLLTDNPERACVVESRNQGSRIITVDFARPVTITSLTFWRRLDRLYLLSPDPSANLLHLKIISEQEHIAKDQRLPLTVRIDDPWQAEAWRAQKFGGKERQWAADALGKYEVTARRLIDDIVVDRKKNIQRIIVCGTSQLTLALCSDLAQRQLERELYTPEGEPPLPKLTLVGERAEEYRGDHEDHQRRLGLTANPVVIDAEPQEPSVATLMRLIDDDPADPVATAVIFVDPDPIVRSAVDATTGTRLAARFPTMPVYAWDPAARVTDELEPVVGQVRTYRLALDKARDRWDRAAELIHTSYVAEMGSDLPPWDELDEFMHGSNRRQVRNALRIVEQYGNHTWSTWDTEPGAPIGKLKGLPPLAQLERMGFDDEAVLAMARAEHEDWCRYLLQAGWKHAETRNDAEKLHDKLVPWAKINADEKLRTTALTSLATTLSRLHALGYRSRPVWEKYERVGSVVAEQRTDPWTWRTQTGETLAGSAGDWEVRESTGGASWSVRDDIFHDTYEQVDGAQWRRRGTFMARRAQPGEQIQTEEGPVTAANGDWVVRGARGEEWPVPAERFAERYRRVETRTPAMT
jgi:hypothetical protein